MSKKEDQTIASNSLIHLSITDKKVAQENAMELFLNLVSQFIYSDLLWCGFTTFCDWFWPSAQPIRCKTKTYFELISTFSAIGTQWVYLLRVLIGRLCHFHAVIGYHNWVCGDGR